MPEDSAQERTEEATARRREQARKKGTVAKSVDLTNAAVMVCLLAVLPFVLSNLGSAFSTGLKTSFSALTPDVAAGTVSTRVLSVLMPSLVALAPLVLAAMAVGLASNFAQVGFVLSPEVLNPNLNKLNPLNGMKRLLSRDSLFDGAKAVAKTSLFGFIAWSVIWADRDSLLNLSTRSAPDALAAIASTGHAICLRVAIAWLVLAAIDYGVQRRRVSKQLRMTKEEVKQEYKEMEQSPELKAAMSARRWRLNRMRMADAVRGADVIVTNPTHFSVALKYDRDKMHAPQVVAKGQDILAFRMRELAKEARIPIVPHPPLARQLYKKCEVGDFVPRELFQAVAEVLAFVYRTIKGVKVA